MPSTNCTSSFPDDYQTRSSVYTKLLAHSKLHDTTAWDGLVIQYNKFLLPVEIRSFPLLNLYPDAIITLLHGTDT